MASDIVNLGKREMYLKLMVNGITSKGFSARTSDSLKSMEESHQDEVIAFSRAITPQTEMRWKKRRSMGHSDRTGRSHRPCLAEVSAKAGHHPAHPIKVLAHQHRQVAEIIIHLGPEKLGPSFL